MASIDGSGKPDAPGDQLVEKEREVQELRRILEQERALARHWRYVASHAAHQNELPIKASSPSIDGHPGTVLPTLTVSEPPPRKSSFVALPLTAPTQLEGATGVNDEKNAAGGILTTSELDLKRLMGTSVIREIGVENHFKNLASTLGESRRNISSTSVQIQDLSLSYMVEQSNKRFLNVGEALLNPFLALLRSGGKKQTFQLKALQHITTAFAPQKMYLVIGGPKCGKTSLLKAIAGRSLRGTGYRLSGSVLYNGEEAGSGGFHMTSLACFVEEVDNNEPLLTVRETLVFSGACIAPVPTRKLLQTDYGRALVESLDVDEATKKELRACRGVGRPKIRYALARQKAETVMTLLGLQGCADTIIGDASRRGVSGGERRRVTLAEVLMGEYSVTCLDEISNGLDSAAAFDIVRMARASVQAFQYCSIIALNQPAPEVLALFDQVLVLRKGALVYQGPPDEAKGYFEGLGFRCPPRTDVADFLVGVTGPAFKSFRASLDELAETGISPAQVQWPGSTKDFVQRFRKSEPGRHLFQEATMSPHKKANSSIKTESSDSGIRRILEAAWRENEQRKFYNTWMTSFVICFHREVRMSEAHTLLYAAPACLVAAVASNIPPQMYASVALTTPIPKTQFKLTFRDRSYVVSRILQDIFLGALTGLVFLNLRTEAVATRFGALYQSLLTIAFQTAACIPAYFVRRHVFYKQKNAGFFSCSSYLLASTTASAPLVLLDAVLFGTLVYWCAGFARDQHGLHFFVFLAHLTMVGWAMMSFFKLTTFLTANLTSAAAASGIVTFFLLLFSGFIISVKDVPNFYTWVMFLNPLFYGFQGLAVNEFIAKNYGALLPGSTETIGETVLGQKGLFTNARWVWWGLLANLGITLFYLCLTLVAMMYLEWLQPVSSADTTPEEAIAQSSLALRGPGLLRRQTTERHLELDREESDVDEDGYSWTSESVQSWGVESSTNTITAFRSFSGLGGGAEDDEDASSTNTSERGGARQGVMGSSVDEETKEAEGLAKDDARGVKFSGQVAEHTYGKETVRPKNENLAHSVLPRAVSSVKLLADLRNGKSSTWQLEAVKAIPFVPTALTFENLWYSVPVNGNETVDLLKGVSGSVAPGCMMALMGSSGAGKTTLLDVLAGRKTEGSIRGEILVNGVPLSSDVFKTISAYVEQFGCISPYMTVAEALQFNAELRLPKEVSASKCRHFVGDVLTLLELDPIANAVVGPPGAGLSFEELKRVTIGCEVVANPSILFLDEPTTGLDARAAFLVVRVMRKLAQTGRAIICTIHQPSKEIFNFFDSLLLLKRGGQTVFCGPLGADSIHLIDYFRSIPGTPALDPGENPATWMLECLGAGTGIGAAVTACNYVAEWETSALCASNIETLRTLTQTPSDAQQAVMASLKTRERASFGKQLLVCLRRAWRSLWRMPEYQIARVLGSGVMGLILGSLYFRQTQDTVAGLVSFMALLFLATTCVSNINSTAVLQVVALEKTSFCREHYNRMYQVGAYTLSWFLCEIPWVLLQTLLYSATFYPTCNYNLAPWRIGWFFIFSFMYLLFSTAFGQAVAAVCPSVQVAQILLNCLVPIFSMMSGMVIIPEDLPGKWKFLWVLTPLNKVFEGLVVTQWGNDNQGSIGFFSIKNKQFEELTRWEFVKDFFGTFALEHRFRNIGVLIAFVAVCNIGYYLALRFGKHENR